MAMQHTVIATRIVVTTATVLPAATAAELSLSESFTEWHTTRVTNVSEK